MRHGATILLSVMLLAAASWPAYASYQVSLVASASEEEVKLGEAFKYSLTVVEYGETDKRTRLVDPEFGKLVVEGVSRKVRAYVANGQASRETTLTFAVYSDDPGEYTIEPAKLMLEDPRTGTFQEMISNPVKVTVLDEKPGVMDDIRDIREPKTFFDRVKRAFVLAALMGFLIVVGGIGIIIWAVRKRRGRPAPGAAPLRVDPKAAALESLSLAGRLMSDPREFYTAVTDAVRACMRDARGMHAVEATTTELVWMCRSTGMKPETLEEVRALFTEADLVKFAKYVPDGERMRVDLERARNIVRNM